MRATRAANWRHPNRPIPENRYRPRTRFVGHDDGTANIEHLSRKNLLALYDLTLTDPKWYGLNREIRAHLGITDEGFDA